MDPVTFIECMGMDAGIVKLYDIMMLDIANLIKMIVMDDTRVFGNVHVSRNRTRLQECIDTLSTYKCDIVADGEAVLTVPVPVGCCYKLPEDSIKGIFVVEGRRKVLMCQEKSHTFRYLARKEKCELRLPKCHCEMQAIDGAVKVSLLHGNLINVFIVLKALGRSSADAKQKILSWTNHKDQVSGFLLESQLDATTFDNSVNISTEGLLAALDNDAKVDMLSLMVCRFAETILSLRQEDDRDCLSFKCVHTPADIVRRHVEKKISKLAQQKRRSGDRRRALIISALGKISRIYPSKLHKKVKHNGIFGLFSNLPNITLPTYVRMMQIARKQTKQLSLSWVRS